MPVNIARGLCCNLEPLEPVHVRVQGSSLLHLLEYDSEKERFPIAHMLSICTRLYADKFEAVNDINPQHQTTP